MSNKVKLVTSEGEIIEVDVDVASKSVLIKGMIDDSGVEEEIPLPNVKRSILNKIVEFCVYIKDNSPPEIRKFFNIENDFTPEEEAQIMEENKWPKSSSEREKKDSKDGLGCIQSS